MRSQIAYALQHPVFDPFEQITAGHFWRCGANMSAGLTVNIGQE
jgi:hypothetical protein